MCVCTCVCASTFLTNLFSIILFLLTLKILQLLFLYYSTSSTPILYTSHSFSILRNHDILGETEPVGESPLETLSTPRAIQEIMRINDTLKSAKNFNSSGGGGQGGGMEFLGCMPINLSRRNLLNVQR